MDFSKIKLEHILFCTAILVAGLVRFLNLGAAPLSETEARLALDAWQFAQGTIAVGEFNPAPYPGYILLTGLFFSLFESTNFLARILPALVGISLLLAPILLRDKLGKSAALLLAFGLALDPGLIVASRLADGPMPALTFGVLAVIAWRRGHPRWAGFLSALLLLSGPPAFQGLLIGALTLLLLRSAPQWKQRETDLSGERPNLSEQIKQGLSVALISLILIGTLFLQVPQGLAALGSSFLAYFTGWTSFAEIPAGRLLAALAVYQPLALIFALIRIGQMLYRRKVEPIDLLMVFWAGISLLHCLVYPGRQTLDLVWAILPIWVLASRELAYQLKQSQSHLSAFGQALLIVLLAGLLWFNLAGLGRTDPQVNSSMARLLLMAGVLLLIAITTILVSMGWSWRNAKHGLILGILGAGSLYLISVFWGSSQVRASMPSELWYARSAGEQETLLQKTARDLSVWKTGFPDRIDVTVISNSASIHWALRNFGQIRITDKIPTQDLPAILITLQSEQPPALTAAYRGQDFIWWTYPGWTGSLPDNVASWLTFRNAPIVQEQIILWARSDLFPGGEVSSSSVSQP